MAEIALLTSERYKKKAKYTTYRPIGSVVAVCDARRIRDKWLEIVCDLVSPNKRESFRNIPGWTYLVEHWTPEIREAFFALHRNETIPPNSQALWDEVVDPQLIVSLGKDPRGLRNITDTWLWSEFERKATFIVVNEDEPDARMSWEGKNLRYKDGNLFIVPMVYHDYKNNTALDAKTLIAIEDKDVIVHPKFDSPISRIYFSEPDLP